jgi:methylase of polypeptide subunit release factors
VPSTENYIFQKKISNRCVENQPFGYMNMHVRSGVFIPRWETEEWTLTLANRLRRLIPSRQTFTLVDLCTGSGCIPLLLKDFISANIEEKFHTKYGKPNNVARFIGIEKSATAIDVARVNLRRSQPTKQRFPDSYCPS